MYETENITNKQMKNTREDTQCSMKYIIYINPINFHF